MSHVQPVRSQAEYTPATPGRMDKLLSRPPMWRRYAPYGVAAVVLLATAVWLLAGKSANVYGVPLDQLTIGTVKEAPFEDFIAVRGTAAPFATHYLTADQGGAVKQVLAEDGATVKAGQPLIILANAPLQLRTSQGERVIVSGYEAFQKIDRLEFGKPDHANN